jgi:hypothetical protein
MEIMNYNQMLVNANAVKVLVNKTIECSKDYTDLRKDDIIEQMINYIYLTFKSAMELNMITREFIINVDSRLRDNLWLTCGPFGGDGQKAQLQVHFSRLNGEIRYFMNENGYWVSQRHVTDDMLRYLIERWERYKQYLDQGIREAIDATNQNNQYKLNQQLKLHDAIKNFQV